MNASTLLNAMLPILRPTHTVQEALDWMMDNQISQLIVVENERYLGIVSEDILLELLNPDLLLAQVPLLHANVFANEEHHLYELLQLVTKFQLRIIAVLDNQSACIGCISAQAIYEAFGQAVGVTEVGAVIVLQINQRDYSLAEISRLIESNGVKILSSYYSIQYTANHQEESLLTLKLNQTNITTVIATLERYDYQIREVYANDPVYTLEQERLDQLLRYLAT